MRRCTPLVLAAIVLAFAAAPHASAAPGVKFGLTDDAWLVSGPGTLDSPLAPPRAVGEAVARPPPPRRHPELGYGRQGLPRRPAEQRHVRCVRNRGGTPVPVGQALGDLERAESA